MISPIVIGQGGQAVMVAPTAGGETDGGADATQAVLSIPESVPADTATASLLSPMDSSTRVTATATGTTSPTSTSVLAQVVTSTSTIETTVSGMRSTPTAASQVVTVTSVATGLVTLTLSATSSSYSTTAVPNTISSSSTLSTHSSVSSEFTSASATASSTVTATAANAPNHFTHSALFIFLLLLSILIVIALIATTVSWLIRRSLLPCCGHHETDDDGLADLVQSFHTPSRSSTLRRASADPNDPEQALRRRSSLFASDPFATDPGKSPFLHSGTGMGEVPWGGTAPSIAVPTPAHLFGETGPLEVRNAVPGEMGLEREHERGNEEHGTPRESVAGSTPRFLSVDGESLGLSPEITADVPQ